MKTRETVNVKTEMVKVEKLVSKPVEVVEYVETKVPGSQTDWSFMRTKWKPVRYIVQKDEWVFVSERPATQEELDAEWFELLDGIEL